MHKREDVSPGTKLMRLKSSSKGEPASMVKNLKLKKTDDNYEIALKLMQRRCANQKSIREAHIAELMNLVPVTLSNKQQDAAGLRKLASTVLEHVQALKV